jgi:hypothetical protein
VVDGLQRISTLASKSFHRRFSRRLDHSKVRALPSCSASAGKKTARAFWTRAKRSLCALMYPLDLRTRYACHRIVTFEFPIAFATRRLLSQVNYVPTLSSCLVLLSVSVANPWVLSKHALPRACRVSRLAAFRIRYRAGHQQRIFAPACRMTLQQTSVQLSYPLGHT